MEELLNEMKAMTFYGYEVNKELIGVMGLQPLGEVTLIRHSYVLPRHQGRGACCSPSSIRFISSLQRMVTFLIKDR
jgi:hypothetical protein